MATIRPFGSLGQRLNNYNYIHESEIGVLSVKVTGLPVSVTHTVKGSLPNCSVWKPCVEVGAAGKVTGIGELQVFPLLEDTVTPVIWPALTFQEIEYPQASRAARAAKDADIC
jgi:hypothetical protein